MNGLGFYSLIDLFALPGLLPVEEEQTIDPEGDQMFLRTDELLPFVQDLINDSLSAGDLHAYGDLLAEHGINPSFYADQVADNMEFLSRNHHLFLDPYSSKKNR